MSGTLTYIEKRLHDAAYQGDVKIVAECVGQGVDVNSQDESGDSALLCAVFAGKQSVVDYLITLRSVNLDAQRKSGATALYIASDKNLSKIVERLLKRGANLNIQTSNGVSPLMVASQNGHADVVKLLLSAGAYINQQMPTGATALYLACQGSHKRVAELLIRKNADVNLRKKDGIGPLWIACQNEDYDLAKILIESNANVNCQRIADGAAPLHFACQKGCVAIVRLLVRNFADVNLRTNKGNTPLNIANQCGHKAIVDILNSNKPLMRKRGICLIINNFKFKNPELNIPSGEKDMVNLVKTFSNLNYDIWQRENLKAHEITSTLNNIASRDHSRFDSFVCILLSHGQEGAIYGSDEKLFTLKDVEAFFSPLNCRSLAEKPKIFFVEACRGSKTPTGIELLTRATAEKPKFSIVPEKADFLFSYPTINEQVSYQHPVDGSHFIRAVCECLNPNSSSLNIFSVLTKVNDVVRSVRAPNGKPLFQLCEMRSTLGKEFDFKCNCPANDGKTTHSH